MTVKRVVDAFKNLYDSTKNTPDNLEWFGIIDECITEWIKLKEEKHKYRWHDLRKNPNDLPDDGEYSVMVKMLCEWDSKYRLYEIRMSYRNKILITGNKVGWGVSYPYDFDFDTDSVIAWREVEPFEEVSE